MLTVRYGVPLTALGLLLLAGAAHLAHYLPLMPDPIASHFDGNGAPNGWMSPSGMVIFEGVLLCFIALVMLGSVRLIDRMPPSMINVPHRDYWLAPEHRAELSQIMMRHMLWLVCWAVALFIAINQLIFTANRDPSTPRLSPENTLLVVGLGLAAIAMWTSTLLRQFRRPPSPG